VEPLPSDDVQSIPGGIHEELLEPFITAVSMTLREMASAEAVVQSAFKKKQHRTIGDVSAVLPLAFPAEGRLVLSFPAATAAALARRVLAEVMAAPDQGMVGDCVGELTNVVAGQAKALLFGSRYHFMLSTPTVITGTGHEIRHPEGAHCLVVTFGSDLGDFALELSLKLAEPSAGESQ
jgi:chemotaxis protein CheX